MVTAQYQYQLICLDCNKSPNGCSWSPCRFNHRCYQCVCNPRSKTRTTRLLSVHIGRRTGSTITRLILLFSFFFCFFWYWFWFLFFMHAINEHYYKHNFAHFCMLIGIYSSYSLVVINTSPLQWWQSSILLGCTLRTCIAITMTETNLLSNQPSDVKVPPGQSKLH